LEAKRRFQLKKEAPVYIAIVLLSTVISPALSVAIEAVVSHHGVSIFALTAKWFVFWAVGIRLFGAGVRQVLQPAFTAREIFGIQSAESYPIVREVGFGNFSMGTLGICSLFHPGWLVPAAVVGGLYYGLAGLLHLVRKDKNVLEQTAMISDAFAFLVLLIVVVRGWA
jgi:hypothetical protein